MTSLLEPPVTTAPPKVGRLVDQFEKGLDAPICLTWELTYACNLSCVHCLSSSGKRDPRELSTEQCKAIIDELQRMQVFYVNIGGGEPTVRSDFWELVDYATEHQVGVKFSTNGVRIDKKVAEQAAHPRSGGAAGLEHLLVVEGLAADAGDRQQNAGNDAGGIATFASVGADHGYRRRRRGGRASWGVAAVRGRQFDPSPHVG